MACGGGGVKNLYGATKNQAKGYKGEIRGSRKGKGKGDKGKKKKR